MGSELMLLAIPSVSQSIFFQENLSKLTKKSVAKSVAKFFILENAEFRNEIVKNEDEAENGQTYWGNLYHDFTYEFGSFHDIIMSFREIMDVYSTEVILILIGQQSTNGF